MEKKLYGDYAKMLQVIVNKSNIQQDNTQQSSSCTATYHPSRKLSKIDEPHMQNTAGEVRTNS